MRSAYRTYHPCHICSFRTLCRIQRKRGAGRSAVLEAGAAVSFCISIGGAVCLWSAVAELFRAQRRGGMALAPAAPGAHPPVPRKRAGQSCHRRPVGERQRESPRPRQRRNARRDPCRQGHGAPFGDTRARDELCLLVVINTASFQLVPTTVAAVRASYGAAAAFDIMPAVWVSSPCLSLPG